MDNSLKWNLLESPLSRVIDESKSELLSLKNKNILITGGSGFIGSWIINVLVKARSRLNIEFGIYVTTRNVKNLEKTIGNAYHEVAILDMNSFQSWQSSGLQMPKFEYIVHSAVSSKDNSVNASQSGFEQDLNFAQHLVSLVEEQNTSVNFIFLSSGVVNQVQNDKHEGKITPYAQMKNDVENFLLSKSDEIKFKVNILRIYNPYGPGIRLLENTAIGDYMAGAFLKGHIVFESNAETRRSFIYITDLLSRLLATFNLGNGNICTLGSVESISLLDLANTISKSFGNVDVSVLQSRFPKIDYFPSPDQVSYTNRLLGRGEFVFLKDGVSEWKAYLEACN